MVGSWSGCRTWRVGVPHVVDRALGLHPFAEDEPAIPEADVLAGDLRDVLGIGAGEPCVIGEHEPEHPVAQGVGLVENLLLEPVGGAVGVGGGEQLRPRDRHAADEGCPEPFGDEGRLVDVSTGDGEASQDELGADVVRPHDVDGPAEDRRRRRPRGVGHHAGERAEQLRVLQRLEHVSGDALPGAADHHEVTAARGGRHERQPSEQRRNRLAGSDAAVPDVDAGVGVDDGLDLFGAHAELVQLQRHPSSPTPMLAAARSRS